MKKYKLQCKVILAVFQTPDHHHHKKLIEGYIGVRNYHYDLLKEFYHFLKDIGVYKDDGIEYFNLTESEYLELNLRFCKFNKIWRIM